MTLGQLIKQLQRLAEEHGNDIDIDINIEADPECTVGLDAIAFELTRTALFPKTDEKFGKPIQNKSSLGLFFS